MLAPPSPALSKVVQGRHGSDFLPCHTHGFELISHPWAVGLGQLIYLTARTWELPHLHCWHLWLDLLYPWKNQTLLWLSAGSTNPSFSSGSPCTS